LTQALSYFLTEAAASLWRGRRAAALSVATIAAALFVLGGFLLVSANLDRLVARWSAAAEFSVYLEDNATPQARDAVDRALAGSGVVATRELVSKDAALQRFRRDFPALAGATAGLDSNPLPASVEVRLRPAADTEEVARLAEQIGTLPGVGDVRYDRQWIERVLTTVALVRGIGVLLAMVLIVAGCLTVANVVRLALFARLNEVRIMALVGAPLAYLRGPFVVEGIMQGGLGAMTAIAVLYAAFRVVEARYADMVASVAGPDRAVFLSLGMAALLVAGGMAVGCLGGLVAARSARDVAAES
jgi:cell division transport system permease protein